MNHIEASPVSERGNTLRPITSKSKSGLPTQLLHTALTVSIWACGSYGECPYAKIAEKLEKISRNNKSWSTRKSDTGRNTFAVRSTHNPPTDEIREEMAQMRTELGLVLKHVTKGAEKINAVNYLAKPPPPNDECYYAEDSYAVNEQTGGFRPSVQGSNQDNWRQGQGNQVGSMVTITVRVIMSEMETTTAITTSTGVTTVTEMIGMGPMSLLKIVKLLLGMAEIVWRELRICCTK